jgi:hypothetical protein
MICAAAQSVVSSFPSEKTHLAIRAYLSASNIKSATNLRKKLGICHKLVTTHCQIATYRFQKKLAKSGFSIEEGITRFIIIIVLLSGYSGDWATPK